MELKKFYSILLDTTISNGFDIQCFSLNFEKLPSYEDFVIAVNLHCKKFKCEEQIPFVLEQWSPSLVYEDEIYQN